MSCSPICVVGERRHQRLDQDPDVVFRNRNSGDPGQGRNQILLLDQEVELASGLENESPFYLSTSFTMEIVSNRSGRLTIGPTLKLVKNLQLFS